MARAGQALGPMGQEPRHGHASERDDPDAEPQR